MSELFYLNELFLNLKVNKVRIYSIFLNSATNFLTHVLLDCFILRTREAQPQWQLQQGVTGVGDGLVSLWCKLTQTIFSASYGCPWPVACIPYRKVYLYCLLSMCRKHVNCFHASQVPNKNDTATERSITQRKRSHNVPSLKVTVTFTG